MHKNLKNVLGYTSVENLLNMDFGLEIIDCIERTFERLYSYASFQNKKESFL